MECSRCDRPLERYALGGRVAVVCESCGYVGVPVEHRSKRRTVESWDDAISRVEAHPEATTVESVTDTATVFDGASGDPDRSPSPTVVRIELPEAASLLADDEGDRESEGETFACDVCGEAFGTRAQLNGHLAVHAGENGDDRS